ncbi:hypothetical protein L1887_58052 [Cichorium endivia]|nr:hypothetical protein L1887_58052 [Cichorium endivia]
MWEDVAGPVPTPTGKRWTKQAPSTLGAVIKASRSLSLRLASRHEDSRAQARATSIATSVQCRCSVHGRRRAALQLGRPRTAQHTRMKPASQRYCSLVTAGV